MKKKKGCSGKDLQERKVIMASRNNTLPADSDSDGSLYSTDIAGDA